MRDQVARLVQLADTLLPCGEQTPSASHRTRRSLTPACAPDDAHVAEEEHLPLRERLADAWQVLLMCFDCFLLNEALTPPLGDAPCRASRTMSGWRRWRRRRP